MDTRWVAVCPMRHGVLVGSTHGPGGWILGCYPYFGLPGILRPLGYKSSLLLLLIALHSWILGKIEIGLSFLAWDRSTCLRCVWSIPCNGRVSLDLGTRGPDVSHDPFGVSAYGDWSISINENTIAWRVHASDLLFHRAFLVLYQPCMSFSWESYLVDPASSHMLVSKIKPCMS